jgi:hypothetical protein
MAADTYERIRDDFVALSVGEVEIRGFGTQGVYSLEDVARPKVTGGAERGGAAARR